MILRRPDTPRRGSRVGQAVADGWLIAAVLCSVAGTILLIVTWYKVSGQALVAEQLPYLASGGFGALALIIAGAGCLSAGRSARVEARLVELLKIATEPVTGARDSRDLAPAPEPTGAAVETDGPVLTVTGGTTYHQPGCRLIAGKDTSRLPVREAIGQGLSPCPICH